LKSAAHLVKAGVETISKNLIRVANSLLE